MPVHPSQPPTSRARGQPESGPYLAPPPTSYLPSTAPHLLQPPPAPRIPTIPLPHVWGAQIVPMLNREPFPIDLLGDLDLELLTRAIGNDRILHHSTIRVLAADRCLLQIISGDAPTSTISFIRRLRRLIRAPLSLNVYRSELPPETQQAVRSYFLSRSGYNGPRLWLDFLNGHRHPQGPTGEVLLQGHRFLWGFRQDGHDWVVDVDLQRRRVVHPHPPPVHYSY
ncbi:hypothetical protein C8R47DRAFT_1163365 [Mycena vitilis]|nr:hypothetical protein C8R47DRAFT_1163365 [Mycena vitilis]